MKRQSLLKKAQQLKSRNLKKLAKPKEKYPKRFSKISKAQRFRGIL